MILAGQSESGAYVASPALEEYRYSWLRDGAFVADAMSRVGKTASAEAFFGWCSEVVLARAERVEELIARHRSGEVIADGEHLPCRFTTEGEEVGVPWSDFQLDGYGLWLWALDAHERRHGTRLDGAAAGAALTERYLAEFWAEPCFDWWEERRGVHAATLGCVQAGLAARGRPEAAAVREALHELVEPPLDGSLLCLAEPFDLVDPTALLDRIEAGLLSPGGGVHRRPADTYYGGGEWLLLTCLLGWCRLRAGREDGARAALRWTAEHATPEGDLPEQARDHLLAPGWYETWSARWGPPASPLMWSHAMFLTLAAELGEA